MSGETWVTFLTVCFVVYLVRRTRALLHASSDGGKEPFSESVRENP
jgi:hypothetical protein